MPRTSACRIGTLALSLLANALAFGPTAGQESTDPTSTDVPASIEVHLGVGRVAGLWAGQAGVAALLDLGRGIRIGGGAWNVLRRVDEGPVLAGSGLELSVVYGGILVDAHIADTPFAARVLAGGGAATLRTLAVGARFDAETFVVVEPALTATLPLPLPLPIPVSAGVLAGYRWVGGAGDLFLIDNDDLRGGRFSLYLRFGPH